VGRFGAAPSSPSKWLDRGEALKESFGGEEGEVCTACARHWRGRSRDLNDMIKVLLQGDTGYEAVGLVGNSVSFKGCQKMTVKCLRSKVGVQSARGGRGMEIRR